MSNGAEGEGEGEGDGDRGATIKTPLREMNKNEALTPVADFSSKAQRAASDSKCYARRRKILRDDNKSEEWMPSTCPSKRSKKRQHSSSSLEDDFQEQDHDSTTRHITKKTLRRARKQPQKQAKVPQNFVQEQQKYFAEVDAFELQEEESAEESSSLKLEQETRSQDESSSGELQQGVEASKELQPESTKDYCSDSESESGSGSEDRSD